MDINGPQQAVEVFRPTVLHRVGIQPKAIGQRPAKLLPHIGRRLVPLGIDDGQAGFDPLRPMIRHRLELIPQQLGILAAGAAVAVGYDFNEHGRLSAFVLVFEGGCFGWWFILFGYRFSPARPLGRFVKFLDRDVRSRTPQNQSDGGFFLPCVHTVVFLGA